MTTVVHINDDYDIYIGRAGHGFDGTFGNPHPVDKPCALCGGVTHRRGNSIALFESYFMNRVATDMDFRQKVLALRGKRLACFCKPKHECHGDILKAWLDSQPEETT